MKPILAVVVLALAGCAAEGNNLRADETRRLMAASADAIEQANRTGRALTAEEIGLVLRSGRANPVIGSWIETCAVRMRVLITDPAFPRCLIGVGSSGV